MIKVKGRLVLSDEESFVEMKDSSGNIIFLKVVDRVFLEELIKQIPCYLGGAYLYDDDVEFYVEREGEYITKIYSGKIVRDNDVFDYAAPLSQ